MSAYEGSVEPFVVSGESAEPSGAGEATFDDPSPWQQYEAPFCHRVLDDFQPDAMLLSRFGGVRSGRAMVDVRHHQGALNYHLHRLGERRYHIAVAPVGWRHSHRRQMAQRVDRDVDLGTPASLGPILACTRATLGRAMQHAAVDADRRRLPIAPAPLAQKRTYILYQQLEAACLNPAPHLLIHHPPRR